MSARVLLLAVLVAVVGGLVFAVLRYIVLSGDAAVEEASLNEAAMDDDGEKMRILFLCTGNSCRSQMAEGWARALKGDVVEAYSAGTLPKGLNQRAVQVMQEVGVDISGHQSKTVEEMERPEFDVVVTVCGHADETCPAFPGRTRVVHVPFDDPPQLAEGIENEAEALAVYRRVRDEIREFVDRLPEAIQ